MATNQIPYTPIERLFALAEDMADGAQAHGAAIGLLQNTEAAIRSALTAAQAAGSTFQAARADKNAKSSTRQIADSNVKSFIAATKKILSLSLGNQWSAEWAAAGWTTPSLVVPASTPERLGLLPAIKAYLTANPTKENAPAGVTATNAQAVYDALSAATAAMNAANATAGQAKAARDSAMEALRQRMIGLVRELTQLLEGDDARWYAFGLNRPDDPETPAVAVDLVVTPGAPGILHLDWADARRAERYKVEIKKTADPEFLEAVQVTDSDATLTGLPTGQTVKLRILSANTAGYAQPGEEVSALVP